MCNGKKSKNEQFGLGKRTLKRTWAADTVGFELLHSRIKKLASFELVFGGSASAASRRYCMQESHTGRHGSAESRIKLLDLTSLISLQLRDFLHMPEDTMVIVWQNNQEQCALNY